MAFLDRFKLRTKLFISFSFAILITFGIGTVLLFSVFYYSVKDSSEENLDNTTKLISDMLQMTESSSLENYLQAAVETNFQKIKELHRQTKESNLSLAEAQRLAKEYLLPQKVGEKGYFFIMDSSSLIISHPNPHFLDLRVNEIESIVKSKREYGNYVEYQLESNGIPQKKAMYLVFFKEWNWYIAATAERTESRRLINLKHIQNQLKEISLGKEGYVFILDTLGGVIFHPFFDNLNNRFIDEIDKKLIETIVKEKDGTLTYKWNNPGDDKERSKIVKFVHLDNLNWIIAASMYYDDIYAPLDKVLNIILITLIIGIVILLFISSKYSSYILDPIRMLNSKFKLAAQNDLSVRMEYARDDELGELSDHFNIFMEQLNHYYSNLTKQIKERMEVEETLKEYQEDLEQKVLMRTKELVNLNEKMKMEIEFRKEITENLKESEEQYKALFENTENIIFLIHKGKIELANSSFVEKLVPNDCEDIRQINFLELFESATREKFSEAFSVMHESHTKSHSFEFRNKDNTGLEKHFEAHISSIHYKASLAFQVIISDITGKKFMEGRVMQAQKMESIGQLAAGIAHEINTPMQFIGDNNTFLISVFDDIFEYIETLKKMIRETNPHQNDEIETLEEEYDIPFLKQETPEALFRTQSGVKRISKIISAMKNFAHPSGKEKKLADINQGIDVTLTISKNEWKYFADVETDFDPNLPLIACSLDEINQVFLNMVVNAAHAIEEKQKSTDDKSKGLIKISTYLEDNFVKIAISDTGVGISEETMFKLFDPFFTTKEVGKGTGQGLSIAYDIIVNKHFGNIDVKSKPGEGATFIITLPMK